MTQTFNANLTHSLFYSVPFALSEEQFDGRVKKICPDALAYQSKGETKDAHFRQMQTVERFLRGGSQTYSVRRFFLRSLCPDAKACGFSDVFLMLSYFEETSVVAFSFHYSVEEILLDQLIGLRQSGQARVYRFGEKEESFSDFAADFAVQLGLPRTFTEQSFLCEVTRFGEFTSPEEIEEKAPDVLYGLLSGDEGYCFVPKELCRERLTYSWSSRDFIRIYGVGKAFLFLNLIASPSHEKYLERQRVFGGEIYGAADEYFFLGSNPLSVNHGILFSVEFVMMLKTLVSDVLTFQSAFGKRKKKMSYYRRIRETREFRRKIILVLEKVEQTAITEIGELSAVLMESQHIAPIVDQVKYLLELLEGDLSLIYSERSNLLVTILTVLGLLLAAWQVFLAL